VNKQDFKELIISWRSTEGYEPIFKALDTWEINTATFLDLHKDPKGKEVSFVKLAGLERLNFS